MSAHCGPRSFITDAFTQGLSVPEILGAIGSTYAKVLMGYSIINIMGAIVQACQ